MNNKELLLKLITNAAVRIDDEEISEGERLAYVEGILEAMFHVVNGMKELREVKIIGGDK